VDANVYVHKAICRRGAFVGFDRQGGNGDAQQVPMVMALIDAGFADHLMFSADASSGYAKTLTVFLAEVESGRRERPGAAPHHGRQPPPISRVRSNALEENRDPDLCGARSQRVETLLDTGAGGVVDKRRHECRRGTQSACATVIQDGLGHKSGQLGICASSNRNKKYG